VCTKWKTGSLSLDQVHPQWKIDTGELNDSNTHMLADPDDKTKDLLDDFYREYEYLKWSLEKKKKLCQNKIKELVNQYDLFFEPAIPSNEHCFIILKNKKNQGVLQDWIFHSLKLLK
jgi:hypothetical protein